MRELKNMDDATLIGQELVQKGAIHALQFLKVEGCTPERLEQMLESTLELAQCVTEEAARRGLPVIEYDTQPESQDTSSEPSITH